MGAAERGESEAWIGLDCGRGPSRTFVPVSTSGWLQVVVSAKASHASCAIALHTAAAGGEWTNFDDVELVGGRAALSILGGDVSSLAKSEAFGGIYRDEPASPATR